MRWEQKKTYPSLNFQPPGNRTYKLPPRNTNDQIPRDTITSPRTQRKRIIRFHNGLALRFAAAEHVVVVFDVGGCVGVVFVFGGVVRGGDGGDEVGWVRDDVEGEWVEGAEGVVDAIGEVARGERYVGCVEDFLGSGLVVVSGSSYQSWCASAQVCFWSIETSSTLLHLYKLLE